MDLTRDREDGESHVHDILAYDFSIWRVLEWHGQDVNHLFCITFLVSPRVDHLRLLKHV